MTITTTVTPLPDAPSRNSPTDFSVKADEFLGALPPFGDELNDIITELNATASDVNDDAATASAAAISATASASSASTSASTASTAATNAVNAFDSFDDRYLGSKTSNPTLDNDGNALLVGALYFNSVANEMRVWNGSAWQSASVIGGTVTTLNVTGDLGVGTPSGTPIGSGIRTLAINGTNGGGVRIEDDGVLQATLYSSGGDLYIQTNVSGDIRYFNASGELIRIKNDGTLLVGTPTKASIEGYRFYKDFGRYDNGNFTGFIGEGNSLGGSFSADFVLRSENGLSLMAGGSEGARLNSNKFFKVSNNAIYQNISSDSHESVSNANSPVHVFSSTNTGSSAIPVQSLIPSGATADLFRGSVSGVADVFRVLASGDVQNTNNSYGAISDAKLKENIVDAPSYLQRFMQVQFRNYNLIGAEETLLGVVSQELEQVFPGLIDESPDVEEVTRTRIVDVPAIEEVLDEDGNVITEARSASTREEDYTEYEPTGTFTKSVKYSILALIQGKVIQEQQSMIESQQALIENLISRVEALEQQ